jgi:hypothetical protein
MSSTVYGLFLYIFSSRYLTEIIWGADTGRIWWTHRT